MGTLVSRNLPFIAATYFYPGKTYARRSRASIYSRAIVVHDDHHFANINEMRHGRADQAGRPRERRAKTLSSLSTSIVCGDGRPSLRKPLSDSARWMGFSRSCNKARQITWRGCPFSSLSFHRIASILRSSGCHKVKQGLKVIGGLIFHWRHYVNRSTVN